MYRRPFKFARKGVRYAGKAIRKTAKFARRRYFGKKGFKPKLLTMASDLYNVSRVLNAEKKEFSFTVTNSLGSPSTQVIFQQVTNITEGTARTQRLGESCKIVSWALEYQFVQQASTVNKRYVKLWLIQYKNDGSAAVDITKFLNNDLNGNPGYSSCRNPDYFRQFRILGSTNLLVDCDQTSGESVQRQGRMYGKVNIHQRYTGSTASTLIWGPMYIVAVVNAGNITTSTGLDCTFKMTQYFYDN